MFQSFYKGISDGLFKCITDEKPDSPGTMYDATSSAGLFFKLSSSFLLPFEASYVATMAGIFL
jgi:hypothetical protein